MNSKLGMTSELDAVMLFGGITFVQHPLGSGCFCSSSWIPWNHISVALQTDYSEVWIALRAWQVSICFVYPMGAVRIYPTKKHSGV